MSNSKMLALELLACGRIDVATAEMYLRGNLTMPVECVLPPNREISHLLYSVRPIWESDRSFPPLRENSFDILNPFL
nr:hypothetical protein [candidate division Zixibacteria bacterium]